MKIKEIMKGFKRVNMYVEMEDEKDALSDNES